MRNRTSDWVLALCAAGMLTCTAWSGRAQEQSRTAAAEAGRRDAAQQSRQQQDEPSRQSMRDALRKADTPDKLFLLQAAESSRAEMRISELAQKKSQSPQVRQVAELILQDHRQFTEELQRLIEQQGLQTPQVMPMMAEQEQRLLESLQGSDFDQEYLSAMKASHARDVSRFEARSHIAKDAAVKRFAADSLRALERHALMVQRAAVVAGLPEGQSAVPASVRMRGTGTGGDRGGDRTGEQK